jgi:hypothetical protein
LHSLRRPLRDGARPLFERSRLSQDTPAIVPELADAARPCLSINSTHVHSPPRELVLQCAPTFVLLLVFGDALDPDLPDSPPGAMCNGEA